MHIMNAISGESNKYWFRQYDAFWWNCLGFVVLLYRHCEAGMTAAAEILTSLHFESISTPRFRTWSLLFKNSDSKFYLTGECFFFLENTGVNVVLFLTTVILITRWPIYCSFLLVSMGNFYPALDQILIWKKSWNKILIKHAGLTPQPNVLGVNKPASAWSLLDQTLG